MLTKIRIRNFKQFEDSGDIELGQTVVFVGPNNSGKTTVLQALALWYAGIREWEVFTDSHISPSSPDIEPSEQPTLNRYELTAIPVPNVALLWRNMRVRNGSPLEIEISVSGIAREQNWEQSLKFIYANEESLNCELGEKQDLLFEIAPRIVFVPSIAGLLQDEPLWQPGRINVLVGQGQTGQVLRNVCYALYETNAQNGNWDKLTAHIKNLFQVELLPPEYIAANDQLRIRYKTLEGVILDLLSSGRGMHQIMLLLAYLYANPKSVLLLDELDAHLEIVLQKEIYELIKEVAKEQESQIIVATHSEVVMERSFQVDTLISFVGKPRRIDAGRNEPSLMAALKEIKAVDYYLAEKLGWVLYVEDFTDTDMLRAFAELLQHSAKDLLKDAFVYELKSDDVSSMNRHFQALQRVKPNLFGIGILDRSANGSTANQLQLNKWQKREIENYLMIPEALEVYAKANQGDEAATLMKTIVAERIAPIDLRNRQNTWWKDTKISDFLDEVFRAYSQQLAIKNPMQNKRNFYEIIPFIPVELIDLEVKEKLDAIVDVANKATPRRD